VSRPRLTLIAGLLGLFALVLGAGAAQAQDYPGTTAGPPPAGCTVVISFSAPALPNATVNVTFTCSSIVAGKTYTGVLNSTPVSLPATVAAQAGKVTFSNVKLPADWKVNATHTGTLVDQASGAALGTDDFFVSAAGAITTPPSTNLPKTGTDYVGPALRGAAVLLAAGGIVLMAARRRRTGITPA